MLDFRFIETLTQDSNNNNIGAVPIATFLKETEQEVSINYPIDGLNFNSFRTLINDSSSIDFKLALPSGYEELSNSIDNWHDDGTNSIDTNNYPEIELTITDAGSNIDDAKARMYFNENLVIGEMYEVRASIKASNSDITICGLRAEHQSNGTNYGLKKYTTIDTTYREVYFKFQATGTGANQLAFLAGNQGTGSVWIKDVSLHRSLDNFLVGSSSKILAAALPINTNKIFDVISHTPFIEYTQEGNTIFVNPTTIEDKVLAVRTLENETYLLKFFPRHTFSIEGDVISAALEENSTYAFLQQRKEAMQLYVPRVNSATSWFVNFKKAPVLVDKQILPLAQGKVRPLVVTGDKPTFLTDRLLQLSHRGLVKWEHDQLPDLMLLRSYLLKDTDFVINDGGAIDNNSALLCKYNVTIQSIDEDKGLILLKDPAPPDIEFSYRLNKEWSLINEELNECIIDPPTSMKIKLLDSGELFYSLNNTSAYVHAKTKTYIPELQQAIAVSKTIAALDIEKASFSGIDVRTEGGMIIDTANFNTDSYTSYGFVGVNPTQLNAIAVKLPDSILDLMITQFKELHYDYANFDDPEGLAAKILYIQTFSSTEYDPEVDPSLQNNLIRIEIETMVNRYLSLGIIPIILASDNTKIF